MKNKIFVISLAILLSGCTQGGASSFITISSEEKNSLTTETNYIPSSISSSFEDLSSEKLSSSVESFSSQQSSSENHASSSANDSSSVSTSQPLEENIVLDFFNINDFHGSIENSSSQGEPGLSKLATYIKQQRAKNEDGFVLTSSGDMWQGSALSNIFKGAIVNEWMSYIGFDCMTLGNHEFDWGVDRIISNMEDMNFPVINCNVEEKELAKPVDWIEDTAMINVKGLNIGFIGAIGEGQGGDILASISYNLNFPDPSDYAVNAAKKLKKEGADLIVYLLHDSCETITDTVASYMDVIFCGHTHDGENEMVNGVPAVQAYSNGKDISHVKLTYNTSTKSITYNTHEIVDLRRLNLPNDADTDAIINRRVTPEIDEKINSRVGRISSKLSKSKQSELMTEYLYEYYKDNYDEFPIYATNYNNARSDMTAGTITYKDVFKSFPFDNEVVVMKIKGSALRNVTYGTFYYPGSTSIVNNNYYYIFTIDYIADYDYYYQPSLGVEIVRRYTGVYPRDIFAEYFGTDYPL